jgi:hypothetical protein
MSGTIGPDTPLVVTLSARQWNSLMWCANEGLGALQALFADVQRQCVQQTVRPPDEPLPEHRPPRPNGAAQEARE